MPSDQISVSWDNTLLDADSQNEKFNLKHGVKVERYLREREREKVVYIYFISDSVESGLRPDWRENTKTPCKYVALMLRS